MIPLLDIFERAALLAGKRILDFYSAGPAVTYKADRSPVTQADDEAEAIILAELARACPDIPVIAEEQVAAGSIPAIEGRAFILVDPLDGTKEFIAKSPDFTVNIALIENGAPAIGVVYAPALGVAYRGRGGQAEKLVIGGGFEVAERKLVAARPVATPPVCVASRSHPSAQTEAYLEGSGTCDVRAIGSSLKFCLLAEGVADLYPRFGTTMEWDTAAGDAVLRAAGGMTVDLGGEPLRYGKTGRAGMPDFVNPDFIARGRRPPSL